MSSSYSSIIRSRWHAIMRQNVTIRPSRRETSVATDGTHYHLTIPTTDTHLRAYLGATVYRVLDPRTRLRVVRALVTHEIGHGLEFAAGWVPQMSGDLRAALWNIRADIRIEYNPLLDDLNGWSADRELLHRCFEPKTASPADQPAARDLNVDASRLVHWMLSYARHGRLFTKRQRPLHRPSDTRYHDIWPTLRAWAEDARLSHHSSDERAIDDLVEALMTWAARHWQQQNTPPPTPPAGTGPHHTPPTGASGSDPSPSLSDLLHQYGQPLKDALDQLRQHLDKEFADAACPTHRKNRRKPRSAKPLRRLLAQPHQSQATHQVVIETGPLGFDIPTHLPANLQSSFEGTDRAHRERFRDSITAPHPHPDLLFDASGLAHHLIAPLRRLLEHHVHAPRRTGPQQINSRQPERLHLAATTGIHDPGAYQRRAVPQRTFERAGLDLALVVDASGSMLSDDKHVAALTATMALARAATSIKEIHLAVAAFTTTVTVVKGLREPRTETDIQHDLARIYATNGYTTLEPAAAWGITHLLRWHHRRNRRALIVITDAALEQDDHHDTATTIRAGQRHGITVIGIGVDGAHGDQLSTLFPTHLHLSPENTQDLPRVLTHLIENLITHDRTR